MHNHWIHSTRLAALSLALLLSSCGDALAQADASPAAYTQSGTQGVSLTWTIENLCFDGQLLALDVRTTPSDTRYAACNDVLGDYEDFAQTDSIRHNGVLSPILVAREGGRYTIIAGERRWRAARLANLSTIPAIVREWDEIKRQEAALVENIQREDLNAIEEAQGVSRLMNECALTQEAVAERLGRSRSAIANLLRLLNLPARIQSAVIDGTLSAGHARVLAGIADSELQGALFAKTLQFGWSVRQLEAAAKNAQTEKKEKPEREPLPIEYEELTERLRSATGLKVKLEGTQEKGKITLQYTSEEELQRLWEWMER